MIKRNKYFGAETAFLEVSVVCAASIVKFDTGINEYAPTETTEAKANAKTDFKIIFFSFNVLLNVSVFQNL